MPQRPGRNDYNALMAQAADYFVVTLVRHTNTKAKGPCPKCGGDDRFTVWLFEGNGWCSRCNFRGWFIEATDRKQIAETARIAKLQQQQELRLRMADCADWREYHQREREELIRVWGSQDVDAASVQRWGLGLCTSCPTASEFSSATIPIFYGSRLLDIRHKLLDVPASRKDEVGKYRSHLSGILPFPFNLDALALCQHILIIEGELKPIRLMAAGPDGPGLEGVIGIPGVNLVDDLLDALSILEDRQTVTIGLDPGANQPAERLAWEIYSRGIETRIADFFVKPDDLRAAYGIGTVREVIRQSRLVR